VHTIRTGTEVDAPPEEVWSVIADFASYAEWNPFVVGIAGEQRLGATLEVRITLGGRMMTFQPQIVDWRPGHSVRWLGKVRAGWLFQGEHGLAVEPLPDGRGFSAMDAALKHRVESRAAQPQRGRTLV
jgi:hypothetical protein